MPNEDILQRCFGLCDWLSLWCLGPRMNHLALYEGPVLANWFEISLSVNSIHWRIVSFFILLVYTDSNCWYIYDHLRFKFLTFSCSPILLFLINRETWTLRIINHSSMHAHIIYLYIYYQPNNNVIVILKPAHNSCNYENCISSCHWVKITSASVYLYDPSIETERSSIPCKNIPVTFPYLTPSPIHNFYGVSVIGKMEGLSTSQHNTLWLGQWHCP